jgi:ribonuclease-3
MFHENQNLSLNIIDNTNLTRLLKYVKPRNVSIYQNVFIHKSSISYIRRIHDNPLIQTNERLEFLGDSILTMVVSGLLYDMFPDKDEGFLTKIRIKIINGKMLAFLSKQMNMQQFIIISPNTKINDKILEDTFESLIGALYLDYKDSVDCLQVIQTFICNIIREMINLEDLIYDDNYKDILLRFAQKNKLEMPQFVVEEVKGFSHNPTFVMKCVFVDTNQTVYQSIEESNTKKAAEQLCSKNILKQLGQENFNI